MFNLEGKVAVVTGGSRGIGRGIALTLADAGADLAICARNTGPLEEVANEIKAKGRKCLAVKADMAQVNDVNKMIEKTIAHFGRIDILVNNAANTEIVFKNFHDTEEAEWDKEISMTFKGTLYFLKAVIPYMITQKWGRIINITSLASKIIFPGQSLYGGCKAAVAGASRAIAAELGPYGITVNCVAPGPTMVPSLEAMIPDEIKKMMCDCPVGRIADPEDIAAMVLYLASEEARMITGQDISIDGGRAY